MTNQPKISTPFNASLSTQKLPSYYSAIAYLGENCYVLIDCQAQTEQIYKLVNEKRPRIASDAPIIRVVSESPLVLNKFVKGMLAHNSNYKYPLFISCEDV